MNDVEAKKQIEQMCNFILQEGREKAEEIKVRTRNEVMAERTSIETQQRLIIMQEHEKAKKRVQVQKKIDKSKKLTESNVTIMKMRDDKINQIKNDTLFKLSEASKLPQYKDLLRYLIIQGLVTIQEHQVTLQCRKEDQKLVDEVLSSSVDQYKKLMKQEVNKDVNVNVVVDKVNYLPAGPKSANDESVTCAGGIQLSAKNNSIICKNTLDHRLDIAFTELLPQIRSCLFGIREKIANNNNDSKQHKGGVSLPK